MKQYENDIERYLYELERLLPGDRKEKVRFLERMQENIAQYEAEATVQVDYDRLVTYFGSPASIAKDYAATWEAEQRETTVTSTYRISKEVIVFWICMAVLLICIIWLLCHFSISFSRCANNYGVTMNA